MAKLGKTIRQSLCTLLCVSMAFTVMACGSEGEKTQGKTGDATIRVAHSADKILQDVNYEDSQLLSEFALNCFRNEYESGQLIITAMNDVEEYTISVGKFSNGNSELPQDSFEIYHEYYHEVESIYDAESKMQPGMYPDALIPMDVAVENEMNTVEAGNNQGIWIAVKTPVGQEAGTYKGTFELTINKKKVEVPATIKVVDYTLPSTVSLKSCFPIQVNYMFNGELDDTQEMYEKHLDILNNFRLAGQYLSSYVPVGIGDAYDKAVYDANIAVKYHAKDNCSAYAIRVFSTSGEYERELSTDYFMAYLKAYIDVSIENNVNLFDKAYVYMGNICDEPTLSGTEALADNAATQFQNCLLEAASYLQGVSCNAKLKESIKKDLLGLSNVVTGELSEKMPTVNTYCPTVDYFGSEVAEVNYQELRDIDKDYWFYTCTVPKIPYPTTHLDDNGVSSRVMGWMAKDYDVSGYLTWELIYYVKHGVGSTVDVYGQDLYDDVHRWGDAYGDGFYVYPGKVFGLDEPIISLRLFTLCDGMEDYEALLDLENSYEAIGTKAGISGLEADSVLGTIYETMYSNARVYADSGEVENAKTALTQLLLLAKSHEVAVEKVSVEGGNVDVTIIAPSDTALSVAGQTPIVKDKLGDCSRFNVTIDLLKAEYSNLEIKGNDISVQLNLGDEMKLLDEFEEKTALTVATDKASLVAEERAGEKVLTITSKTAETLNVIYNVEKNALTRNTENMNLVVYNNGNTRERMTVYVNGQVVMDTVYVEPGKNVFHFSRIQDMNWATIKTVNTLVFQFEESATATRSFSFDSLSVFMDKK